MTAIFKYVPYTEIYQADVKRFIHALYAGDPDCKRMTDEKISQTLSFFNHNPGSGQIFIFLSDDKPVGYSIVCPFWSNEYGGIVLLIDELFITEQYRNRKAGSGFIAYLKDGGYMHCVAIVLEVTSHNPDAFRLYERLGFRLTGRRHLICHTE